MYRNVMNQLAVWSEMKQGTILLVKGALGVGKTWIVKDFATAFFSELFYVDFCQSKELCKLIDKGLTLENFDYVLGEHFSNKDLSEGLLVFDEVNLTDNGMRLICDYSRLKPNYTICVIASTMSNTYIEKEFGDCSMVVSVYPMNFEEFLIANKQSNLINIVENNKVKTITAEDRKRILTYLKYFMLTGGMPEVVQEFIKSGDFHRVEKVQKRILDMYNKLIKKSPSLALAQRSKRIWKSIPKQLEKDNKKFMFKIAEVNARAREYNIATEYLCDLGIVRKLNRIKEGNIPLDNQVDLKSFELFLIDHGLLRVMAGLEVDETCELKGIMSELDGAVGEQYVFEELSKNIDKIYYWVSGATARVPFVFEGDNEAVPIDIRIKDNTKAQNIKVFKNKYESKLSMKFSLDDTYFEKGFLNIPLFGLWNL